MKAAYCCLKLVFVSSEINDNPSRFEFYEIFNAF